MNWNSAGKEAGAEYALTVSFVLRGELLWAKPGHEIAFGQKIFAAKSPANGQGRMGDAAAEYEGKCVTNRKAGTSDHPRKVEYWG